MVLEHEFAVPLYLDTVELNTRTLLTRVTAFDSAETVKTTNFQKRGHDLLRGSDSSVAL